MCTVEKLLIIIGTDTDDVIKRVTKLAAKYEIVYGILLATANQTAANGVTFTDGSVKFNHAKDPNAGGGKEEEKGNSK